MNNLHYTYTCHLEEQRMEVVSAEGWYCDDLSTTQVLKSLGPHWLWNDKPYFDS